MSEKIRVAVVFGGRSQEHEVSLMSAESILKALDPTRFTPVPIGITREGKWIVGGDPLAALKQLAGQPTDKQDLSAPPLPAAFLVDPTEPGLVPLGERSGGQHSGQPSGEHDVRHSDEPGSEQSGDRGEDRGEDRGGDRAGQLTGQQGGREVTQYGPHHEDFGFDVVFPVLHGPYGEDGTVQGLLELANVPYVGSGVAASAVGMDKAFMKEMFRSAGLPIVDHVVVMRSEWRRDPDAVQSRIVEKIGFPCFVKPANLGSSVGISKVKKQADLARAIDEAALHDRKILVEKSAEGFAEIECSVLGNDDPEASIAGEIVPGAEFYDYHAKYIDDTSELIIPARISPQAMRRVQELAIAAFRAIDAAGLARVDFFVHPETEEIYVNEINTMPGFTRISMYPKLWAASGVSYSELITRLIELAFERHRERNM